MTLLKVRQKWDQVVTRVRGAKVSLGGAIGRANVAAYANGTITLEVGDKINQQILQGDTPLIVTSASDVYDRPIKIAVHLRGAHDEPAETPAAAPERGESENLLAVADQLFGLG